MNLVDLGVDPFEGRNDEGGRFPRSVLSSSENISSGQCDGNSFLLNRRWFLKLRPTISARETCEGRRERLAYSCFEDSHEQFSLEKVIFKLVSFGRSNILSTSNR